jgi:hypothetical protein
MNFIQQENWDNAGIMEQYWVLNHIYNHIMRNLECLVSANSLWWSKHERISPFQWSSQCSFPTAVRLLGFNLWVGVCRAAGATSTINQKESSNIIFQYDNCLPHPLLFLAMSLKKSSLLWDFRQLSSTNRKIVQPFLAGLAFHLAHLEWGTTISSWWFQPLWKILVNGKDYPIYYGKIKRVPNHQPYFHSTQALFEAPGVVVGCEKVPHGATKRLQLMLVQRHLNNRKCQLKS